MPTRHHESWIFTSSLIEKYFLVDVVTEELNKRYQPSSGVLPIFTHIELADLIIAHCTEEEKRKIGEYDRHCIISYIPTDTAENPVPHLYFFGMSGEIDFVIDEKKMRAIFGTVNSTFKRNLLTRDFLANIIDQKLLTNANVLKTIAHIIQTQGDKPWFDIPQAPQATDEDLEIIFAEAMARIALSSPRVLGKQVRNILYEYGYQDQTMGTQKIQDLAERRKR